MDKIQTNNEEKYFYNFTTDEYCKPKKLVDLNAQDKSNLRNLQIRETNCCICDIDNPMDSFYTTYMNTTKDSNGNIMAYDEVSFTKITNDEDNYYIKSKITNLKDKTNNNILELNPEKYNETLNKLLVQTKRRLYQLYQTNQIIEKKMNLFHFSYYGGIEIKILLKDNIGYNSDSMEASNLLEIGDNKTDLAIFNKNTIKIDKIIKYLKQLSMIQNTPCGCELFNLINNKK